eukprot:COSAG04_NODE_1080_length_8401_cov_4.323898_7_plen_207_part_00
MRCSQSPLPVKCEERPECTARPNMVVATIPICAKLGKHVAKHVNCIIYRSSISSTCYTSMAALRSGLRPVARRLLRLRSVRSARTRPLHAPNRARVERGTRQTRSSNLRGQQLRRPVNNDIAGILEECNPDASDIVAADSRNGSSASSKVPQCIPTDSLLPICWWTRTASFGVTCCERAVGQPRRAVCAQAAQGSHGRRVDLPAVP